MYIQRRASMHLIWGYQKHLNVGLEEMSRMCAGEASEVRPVTVGTTMKKPGMWEPGCRQIKNTASPWDSPSFKTPLDSHLFHEAGITGPQQTGHQPLLCYLFRFFACHATCLSVRFFSWRLGCCGEWGHIVRQVPGEVIGTSHGRWINGSYHYYY